MLAHQCALNTHATRPMLQHDLSTTATLNAPNTPDVLSKLQSILHTRSICTYTALHLIYNQELRFYLGTQQELPKTTKQDQAKANSTPGSVSCLATPTTPNWGTTGCITPTCAHIPHCCIKGVLLSRTLQVPCKVRKQVRASPQITHTFTTCTQVA